MSAFSEIFQILFQLSVVEFVLLLLYRLLSFIQLLVCPHNFVLVLPSHMFLYFQFYYLFPVLSVVFYFFICALVCFSICDSAVISFCALQFQYPSFSPRRTYPSFFNISFLFVAFYFLVSIYIQLPPEALF